jgi:hypothetical protein
MHKDKTLSNVHFYEPQYVLYIYDEPVELWLIDSFFKKSFQ